MWQCLYFLNSYATRLLHPVMIFSVFPMGMNMHCSCIRYSCMHYSNCDVLCLFVFPQAKHSCNSDHSITELHAFSYISTSELSLKFQKYWWSKKNSHTLFLWSDSHCLLLNIIYFTFFTTVWGLQRAGQIFLFFLLPAF